MSALKTSNLPVDRDDASTDLCFQRGAVVGSLDESFCCSHLRRSFGALRTVDRLGRLISSSTPLNNEYVWKVELNSYQNEYKCESPLEVHTQSHPDWHPLMRLHSRRVARSIV